jgi:serine/threonine protein kinase
MLKEPVDQFVGKTLGNYSIEQLLGHSELEAVYKAWHHEQQRAVMITVFLLPEEFSAQARERFLTHFMQEGAKLIKLCHPNIAPCYDFGEDSGYPYLVYPFVNGNSLAHLLKEQMRFNPERTLDILIQVTAALDYAHSHGIAHGSLSPATILLDEQHTVQVTRLGFVDLLEMRSIQQKSQSSANRFSIAGTPLGSPAYVAPEWAEARPVDFRMDIYALGATIFELLSGEIPFTGGGPLRTGKQHTLASLHALNPEVPAALDPVVQQALDHDPARRFQSAGDMARAFEWVLKATEEAIPIAPTTPLFSVMPSLKQRYGVKPQSSAFVQERRRVLAMIAGVGVVAAGAGVVAMNLSHLVQQMTQSQISSGQTTTSTSLTQDNPNTSHAPQSVNNVPQTTPPAKPTPTATPRSASLSTPVTQPTTTPSSPIPTPTPTPSHTGAIIGFAKQPIDTANNFINPADGSASLLIRLPNGSFVAYEQACTHQEVAVHYNPNTHKLVCPKHNAIFDPANGGRVVQGPAHKALPAVAIRVNADGTITTG